MTSTLSEMAAALMKALSLRFQNRRSNCWSMFSQATSRGLVNCTIHALLSVPRFRPLVAMLEVSATPSTISQKVVRSTSFVSGSLGSLVVPNDASLIHTSGRRSETHSEVVVACHLPLVVSQHFEMCSLQEGAKIVQEANLQIIQFSSACVKDLFGAWLIHKAHSSKGKQPSATTSR